MLFDIDQALICTAGAGLRCMARAVDELRGHRPDAVLADLSDAV